MNLWACLYAARWLVFLLAVLTACMYLVESTRLFVRGWLFVGECVAISTIASLLLWHRFAVSACLVIVQGVLVPFVFVMLAQHRYQGGINNEYAPWFHLFLGLALIQGLLLMASLFIRWRREGDFT